MQNGSGEVEEEGFDRAGVMEGEGASVFGIQGISGRELQAADFGFAGDELEPKSPARPQLMRDRTAGRGLHAIDVGVLADVRGPLATVIRDDEHLRGRELRGRRLPLGVSWLKVRAIGLDPDLDEMQSLRLRRIVFAMLHAATRTHDLDLPWNDLRVVAQAVAVLDEPFEDIREDFHVPMPVGRKTHRRVDEVLIDDPEGPKTHVGGVMVIGETETVPGHQPAVVGEAAVPGSSYRKVHITANLGRKTVKSTTPPYFPDGISLKTPPRIGLCL